MNSPLPTSYESMHRPDAGLGSKIDDLAHGASEMALDGARAVRERALHARDSTAHFVQDRPLAALLIAAGAGAAVMLLAGLLMRSLAAPHR